MLKLETCENCGCKRVSPTISPREQEVVVLVAQGLTNKEIALKSGIEVGTVKNHLRNVALKLNLPRRTALVTWVHSIHPDWLEDKVPA